MRRRDFGFVSRSASLPLIGMLAACVMASTTAGDGGVGIYYASQADADAALERFAEENPSCQLWTNWQKMCSWTGPDGNSFCVRDAEQPVEPSTPFCARRNRALEPRAAAELFVGNYDVNTEGRAAQASRNRYCVRFRSDNMDGSEGFRCFLYMAERPFNGMRDPSGSHPACSEWGKFNSVGPYFCRAISSVSPCPDLRGHVAPPRITADGLYAGSSPVAESMPIWGVFCP